MTGECSDRSGFLFSHACGNPAAQLCGRCARPMCQQHAYAAHEGMVCATCLKAGRGSDKREVADEPYFYSRTRYRGYGHYGHGHWGSGHRQTSGYDRNDFTEADGASTQAEASDSFEHDMDASLIHPSVSG